MLKAAGGLGGDAGTALSWAGGLREGPRLLTSSAPQSRGDGRLGASLRGPVSSRGAASAAQRPPCLPHRAHVPGFRQQPRLLGSHARRRRPQSGGLGSAQEGLLVADTVALVTVSTAHARLLPRRQPPLTGRTPTGSAPAAHRPVSPSGAPSPARRALGSRSQAPASAPHGAVFHAQRRSPLTRGP